MKKLLNVFLCLFMLLGLLSVIHTRAEDNDVEIKEDTTDVVQTASNEQDDNLPENSEVEVEKDKEDDTAPNEITSETDKIEKSEDQTQQDQNDNKDLEEDNKSEELEDKPEKESYTDEYGHLITFDENGRKYIDGIPLILDDSGISTSMHESMHENEYDFSIPDAQLRKEKDNSEVGLLGGNLPALLGSASDTEYETVKQLTRYTCPISRQEHSYVIDEGGYISYENSPRDDADCDYGHWGPDGNGDYFDGYRCESNPTYGYYYTYTYGGYETAPYGSYQGMCNSLETWDIEHVYVADGQGRYNTWEIHHPEAAFKGYCFSHHLGSPHGIYDRVLGNDRNFVDGGILDNPNRTSTPASSNGSYEEAFKTVLYFGFPNNATDIQGRYGLTDTEYMVLTHLLIWHYSDGSDNYSTIMSGGNVEAVGSVAHNSANFRAAATELYNLKYTDIPESVRDKLNLYVYISRDGNQSVMGLESLQFDPRGGVNIIKVDQDNNPLGGAMFGIYDSDGTLVRQVESNSDGLASVCQTDPQGGLPLGTYTVRELRAPMGYNVSTDYFTFRITEDNQVANGGIKNGYAEGGTQTIKFQNGNNTPPGDIQAGGLKIMKKDDSNRPVVQAQYTVYDSSDTSVLTLTTNSTGYAETSKYALPTGSYYLLETRTPEGYIPDTTRHNFTVGSGGTYTELYNLVNVEKSGTVDIKLLKEYYIYDENGDPVQVTNNQSFLFNLNRLYGKDPTTGELDYDFVARAEADEEGNIIFEDIPIKASDGSVINFFVQEVDPDSCTEIIYDTEPRFLEVHIIDDGSNTLTGVVWYEEGDTPVFKNYRRRQDISGRMWFDADWDGIQDTEESSLENMEVCLLRTTRSSTGGQAVNIDGETFYDAYNMSGEILECVMTDTNGNYRFDDVEAGTYVVVSEVGEKIVVTYKNIGSDSTIDSDADRTETHAIIRDIATGSWCTFDDYREFPHNDIGIVVLPEKHVYDDMGNDINDKCVDLNDNLNYEIKFENPFNYAKTFVFEDIIPENTVFVSADNNGSYDEIARKITWTMEDVGAHEEITLNFIVYTNATKIHPINEASVTFDNTTLWSNKVENWVAEVILHKFGPFGETEEFLEGAKIEVRDVHNTLIDSWTTDDKEHLIQNLQFGEYVMTETLAPAGYVIKKESIPFKLVKWENSVTGN